MYQGTTPALTFRVPGVDLTDKTVYVSIRSTGGKELTKSGTQLVVTYNNDTEGAEYSLVACPLTQRETLDMRPGEAECQIRFIDGNGSAWATKKARVNVWDVIHKAVIQYEQ